MKLSDFNLAEENAEDDLHSLLERFNDTSRDYPRNQTVHRIFSEQAQATPESIAVDAPDGTLTYRQLDEQSNQLARFLLEQNLAPEEFVGVILDRSCLMIVTLLGILKAGGAYLPINDDYPIARIIFMLQDTDTRVLISSKRYIRLANKLQWDCPKLKTLFCPDSNDIYGEFEEVPAMMKESTWNYLRRDTFDDISGGGWRSSFTGEWLSREVMDEYGDNARRKLEPFCNANTRILEIGCASGISMFRIAPKVAYYCGTELGQDILRWSESEAKRRNLNNIKLEYLAGHQIDRLTEGDFNIVIINSVVQCFSGHNYLRDVLRKAIDKMSDQGIFFLGNLWDQDLKTTFEKDLEKFARENTGNVYCTKLDRNGELFIARAFLEDLRHDFPEIQDIEYSKMLGEHTSELSTYGFDAIIHIDKSPSKQPPTPRQKQQCDARQLGENFQPLQSDQISGDNLAYLLYTSGTTGSPKGVTVEHHSILRLVLDTNFIKLGPDSVILQTGALAFDASTFEIWGALLNGGRICFTEQQVILDARKLKQIIAGKGINTVFFTTGLLNLLIDDDISMFENLEIVLSGGEEQSLRHMNALREQFPNLRLLNVYGPTENTTFTTYYPVEKAHDKPLPIGYPISNSTVYILDNNLKPVPIGVAGELFTGGDGLARGYWNDRELSEKKFIKHPIVGGARLYATGDLARWLPDGAVEFLGRIDDQVKIRGYRIEPGETEAKIRGHQDIEKACVIARKINNGEKALLAYVVIKANSELDMDQLRDYLKTILPDYMIPAHLIQLKELPLNQNGKIDKKKLPNPQLGNSNHVATPPETNTQKRLLPIWENVLGHNNIGIHDNFFDLGGHSLKVTQLMSQIHDTLQLDLALTVVFNTPTISALASYIDDLDGIDPRLVEEAIVPLSKPSEKKEQNLFGFPPGSGFSLAYSGLADLLPDHAVYGLAYIENDNRMQSYAELIKNTQSTGPYIIFGYSGGGKLAFQVAAELEQRGMDVSDIIMIDAARYLIPVVFSDEQIEADAADFLGNITSSVLRKKAFQRAKAYRDYLSSCVETAKIRANIHLIKSEDSLEFYQDKTGQTVATISGWKELTSGTFTIHEGSGIHKDMLTEPYLKKNADQLHKILGDIRLRRESGE